MDYKVMRSNTGDGLDWDYKCLYHATQDKSTGVVSHETEDVLI